MHGRRIGERREPPCELKVQRWLGGPGEHVWREPRGLQARLPVPGLPEPRYGFDQAGEAPVDPRLAHVRHDADSTSASAVDGRERQRVFLAAEAHGQRGRLGQPGALPGEQVITDLVAVPRTPGPAEHPQMAGEELAARPALAAVLVELVAEIGDAGRADDLRDIATLGPVEVREVAAHDALRGAGQVVVDRACHVSGSLADLG